MSPRRNSDEEAARRGVDRYRPGGQGSRSRSPLPNRRREGGRRPGARRDGGGRRGGRDEGGDKGGRGGQAARPKKTQEELDAEMDNYFGGNSGAANGTVAASGPMEDDIDMGIE